MAKILLVEDDETGRYALSKYLTRAGHEVTEAEDGEIAFKLFRGESFDIVITDIVMPNVEGIELVNLLLEIQPDIPIIGISGGGRLEGAGYLKLIKALGASATLEKPFEPEALLALVDQFMSS